LFPTNHRRISISCASLSLTSFPSPTPPHPPLPNQVEAVAALAMAARPPAGSCRSRSGEGRGGAQAVHSPLADCDMQRTPAACLVGAGRATSDVLRLHGLLCAELPGLRERRQGQLGVPCVRRQPASLLETQVGNPMTITIPSLGCSACMSYRFHRKQMICLTIDPWRLYGPGCSCTRLPAHPQQQRGRPPHLRRQCHSTSPIPQNACLCFSIMSRLCFKQKDRECPDSTDLAFVRFHLFRREANGR